MNSIKSKENVLLILGSDSSWEDSNENYICSSIASSLMNEVNAKKTIEDLLNEKQTNFFKRVKCFSSALKKPKGVTIINWFR